VVASMAASFVANCVRNFWAHAVIFCGHFPEGVETFPEEQLEGETRGQWYVRQMLGSANLSGTPLLHTMTGNLSHQIEHHIFPDIPSNRYAEIAPRVREICERYGLSYTIGPLRKQYGNVLRKINRYALPRRAESTAARAKLAASFAALPVRSATADAPAHQQPVRLAG
jgi:fatty acid desaturase